jgi:predicted amidohydrolase YtcJ
MDRGNRPCDKDRAPMLTLLATAALVDLVLVNGRIWTADREVQALAAYQGRVVAAGSDAEMRALAGPEARVIDLRGRRSLPGFRDSHVHVLAAGLGLSQVSLKDAPDETEFGRRLREFDRKLPPGSWIRGGRWDHDRTFGGKLPTKELIDKYVPGRAVVIDRYDGHMAVANSRALSLAGISAETPDPPGGVIYRVAGSREPSGILRDKAAGLVEGKAPPLSEAEIDEAVRAALVQAARDGVTGLEDMGTDLPGTGDAALARLFRRYQELARDGHLTARIALWWPLRSWAQLAQLGVESSLGGDLVRVGGLKGYMDGSLGSSTAKMFAPYLNEPGSTGIFVTDPAKLREWTRGADAEGLRVSLHAIGDRGNAELLDIFAEVERLNGPRDRRFRDEHAQHLRAQDIPRFKALEVVASMQPYHVIDDGRWAENRIGAEVLRTSYAYRSLLDAGAHLAFGSDWPVAPLSPILGIDAAVKRRTLDGKHPEGWFPAQRISAREAVEAYTRGAAWAAMRERDEGSLEPGKLADLVVLTRDILDPGESASIAEAQVAMTILGGRVVFEAR